MSGVILLTHGPLGEALVGTGRMIAGDAGAPVAIGFTPAMSPDRLREELAAAAAALSGDEHLLVADLPGGTPARVAAAYAAEAGHHVVTGVNLPMLLEILLADPAATAAELAERAVQAGRDGVLDLGAALRREGGAS
ncbi:PTS sugar transporter subunit IIA [Streptomyces sp. MAR4 CNX-425]|uniref:PTS sugar transporter subunit IIA n=1 Tax=Streptomyces sp. MAR4 CNX-425 TaxID=3406343 RepID=UPI003B5045F2